MKARLSNFELLRIITMLFIIAGHYVGQGSLISAVSPGSVNYFFLSIIGGGARIGVNIFMMLSVWFMVDGKFKSSQAIKIWSIVFFYGVTISLLILLGGGYPVSKKQFLQCCLPFFGRPVWYASAYLIVLLLSPYLKLILEWPQKKLKNIIIILFTAVCLLPTIASYMDTFIDACVWFLFIFLVVGYYKKYMADRVKLKGWIAAIVSLMLYLSLTFISAWANLKADNYLICQKITAIFNQWLLDFKSLPNLLCAAGIFYFFTKVKMKVNRTINYIASGSFAAYVIHQTQTFYPYLWNNILNGKAYVNNKIFFVIFIIQICALYMVCLVFERIRMKCIEPIWEKSRLYIRMCKMLTSFYE